MTEIKKFQKNIWENDYKSLKNYLWTEKKVLRFLSAVHYSLNNTPKLLNCEEQSLKQAFLKCAELNLFPSNVTWEAYVIPYWKEAQFQLWYKWTVTLLYRAWVENIFAEIVRENDECEIIAWTSPWIYHKIPKSWWRWNDVWAYVVVRLNWGNVWKYMSKEEIDEIMKFSKSKNSETSPRKKENDPERWMWKKTVLKQVAKMLPTNDEVVMWFSYDNEEADINDYHKKKQEKKFEESWATIDEVLNPNDLKWENSTSNNEQQNGLSSENEW